ncbi:MAG: DUF1330 domain-containing protein [Alphaproteobacteria bacterium]
MKGYWIILGTEVTDPAAQSEYGKLWEPIAKKYQARLNPTATAPSLMESRDTARVIIVEFPTYEMAVECYNDPDYAAAAKFAQAASKRDLLIVAGNLD